MILSRFPWNKWGFWMTLISLIILRRQPFILSACHSELFLVHGRYQNTHLESWRNPCLLNWETISEQVQEVFKATATSKRYSGQHSNTPQVSIKCRSRSRRQLFNDQYSGLSTHQRSGWFRHLGGMPFCSQTKNSMSTRWSHHNAEILAPRFSLH